ncbi:MAG TPA: UDP-N-acetylmuramate dehydrogenase [Candidatus Binatia bacterium]|nr:UDP-N-acetylmuramate dehydrogenase [Candidatus Binatia bacterium]
MSAGIRDSAGRPRKAAGSPALAPDASGFGIRGALRAHEPMASHTSWRVGGPADRYFEPADREDLLSFIASLPSSEPVLWLGLGSNLLVRDGGFRGTVIALHGALDQIQLDPAVHESQIPNPEAPGASAGDAGSSNGRPAESRLVYAEAGVHCARLAKFAQREKLAGLGFMAGIPGTVGGALAMNAGAWGGETWPVVAQAEVVHRGGRVEWLAPSAFRFGYRHVETPADFLGFVGARFSVTADADGAHERYTREALAKRKATQPVGRPSAGSTFRNPPGGHAAKLIEESGLKGHRIGGAEVSPLHANFLITQDGARAADVEALIAHVQDVVQGRTGVRLETEVRIVGEADHA